ncbi:glycoside hydrolase family 97 protein [Allomuricauda sp. F6463D]|uniref:glycoside hydrolase family 97 protein n=1 Tax=Allomuricauda sp. F6463D TaxID=2926409 RepID=UPI001FF5DE72|nr:glycoside hydrolase family 97 protein [Muricauda sp. F6463D]MCK0160215.1 glycoside hydrolase family 97 protein [Muricauda sp. F6463D]
MKKTITLLLLIGSILSCTKESTPLSVTSPNGSNSINFHLSEDGSPYYFVNHNNKIVIDSSSMGFDFKDQNALKSNLNIINSTAKTVNETWEMPWGEQKEVVNHYNELVVELEEAVAPNRKLNIYFRAYNDGIGFRYEFMQQHGIDSIIILDENTEFQLTEDYTSWWIPGDWDIYEHLYNTTKISEIDAISKRNNADLKQTYIPENAVNTPVTMRGEDGLHLSFHEANLTDYAGMTLKVDNESLLLTSELVGSGRSGYKVKRELPFKTPWRTVQIADKASELIESKLIVNLNEPNKLGDVSWFEPKKYVGIWWEMHLGKSTWDYAGSQDMGTFTEDVKPTGKHGATTENTKRYIDFASENNIKGVLVEGWNTGWEHWVGFEDREGVFDFITPYPDYDLEGLNKYAKEKGVEIIMHHETSAAPRTYEQQLDTAYQLMNKLGIHSVKTGYVGKIIPKGEYHHGQWMVNHYRKVLETAAKYNVAINAHEPIKATGLRRTYPNAISREGLRGQEFNAWSADGGNPAEHLPIVAFTRMLAGPIDFTPGVFDIELPTKENNRVSTTIAQQLALYVVIYSPVQMASDLPENYENQPALQFIRDVGVDWDQTKVLNGEVGDYVTIARKERKTGNWFIGGITDENAREITIGFDFLDDGTDYEAIIYKDAEDAHYKNNPTAIAIENINIDKGSTLTVPMAEGGGFAISLIKKNN